MLMPEILRRRVIESKKETDLHDVLCELFRSKGFQKVHKTHGPAERGIDVAFCVPTPGLSDTWCGVVVKAGGIGGGTSHSNDLDVIITQAERAMLNAYNDPVFLDRTYYIDRLFVVTNGHFTSNAQTRIRQYLTERGHKRTEFWGIERLVQEIDKNRPELYASEYPFLLRFIENSERSFTQERELVVRSAKGDVQLPDIFVDPVLLKLNAEVRPSMTFDELLEIFRKGQKVEVRSIYEKLHRPGTRVVVLGDPGSGKTMLVRSILRYLAQSFSRALSSVKSLEDVGRVTKSAVLPIVISAHELMPIEGTRIDIAAALELQLSTVAGHDAESILSLVKEERLRLLIILDGLDEIADETQRSSVADSLTAWAHVHNEASIIVTSRIAEFCSLATCFSDSYEVLDIQPLEWKQIREIVSKLAGVLNFDRLEMLKVVQRELGSLLGRLPSTPMVYTLLLMTLSTAQHKEIPASLTMLYHDFMDLLLGKWDTSKGVAALFESKVKVGFLAQLAYEMQSTRKAEITADEVFLSAEKYFDEQGIDKGEGGTKSAALVDDIMRRSSILTGRRSSYYFRHQSYQEYFAASYFDMMRLPVDEMIDRTLDDWWNNTVFFYCGLRERIDEHVLDRMRSIEAPMPGGIMLRAMSFGHFVQAAFMSPMSAKRKAVQYGLEDVVAFRDWLQTAAKETPRGILTGMGASWSLRFAAFLTRQGFSSTVLVPALVAYFATLEGDTAPNSGLKKFLAAAALSELGVHDQLLETLRSSNDDIIKAYTLRRLESVTGGKKSELELDKRSEQLLRKTKRALTKNLARRVFDPDRMKRRKGREPED